MCVCVYVRIRENFEVYYTSDTAKFAEIFCREMEHRHTCIIILTKTSSEAGHGLGLGLGLAI